MTNRGARGALWKAIGPGLLFAGAAIGVSHLVQSTRAGAQFGLSLAALVVIAHIVKFPALSFGPRYAQASGKSLVHAYRSQGHVAMLVLWLVIGGTAVPIVVAITAVTGAIASAAIAPYTGAPGTPEAATALLALCAVWLLIGGFKWLNLLIRPLIAILAFTTLIAAALQIGNLDLSNLGPPPAQTYTLATLPFLLALVGWMPAPLDISVWNSIWSVDRANQTGARPSPRNAAIDFITGYGACIVLALAFLVLGAVLIYQAGREPAARAGIAAQVIELYTASLGDWSRPLIATCAVAAMLSTLLTVADAIPRTLAEMAAPRSAGKNKSHAYRVALLAVAGVSIAVIWIVEAAERGMLAIVDFATIMAFVSTPLLAFFNHRAMFSPEVPAQLRPSRAMRTLSWIAIALFLGFSAVYLYTKFTASRTPPPAPAPAQAESAG